MSWYKHQGSTLILNIRVQPRARQDQWGEILGESIKLKIKAPPVDGKANAYLIRYLADYFQIAKNQIHIESGQHNRNKRVRFDLTEAQIQAILNQVPFHS